MKEFTVTISEAERNHISSCLGIATKQIMKENFLRGDPISNQMTEEWLKIQERFESLASDTKRMVEP